MAGRQDAPALARIDTRRRILALVTRGLPITNRRNEIVALVIPDADGYVHQHAEEVRLQVEDGIRRTA